MRSKRLVTCTRRIVKTGFSGSVCTKTIESLPSSTMALIGTSTTFFGGSSSTVAVTNCPARSNPFGFGMWPRTTAVCWLGSIR